MADPNSLTPLLIITLSVIGLVIIFFAIASMASSRRVTAGGKASSDAPEGAVAAVASLEKARSVAKAAQQAQGKSS